MEAEPSPCHSGTAVQWFVDVATGLTGNTRMALHGHRWAPQLRDNLN